MAPLIIAFGHKARNGKDTAGEAVVRYYRGKRGVAVAHGYDTHTLKTFPEAGLFKFADALYDICRKQYGMQGKDAPLLQRIGSEYRAQDQDYWVKELFKSIDPKTDIVVITDLRYQNEAEYIKSQGGFTVNVVRKNEDGSRYVADDRPASHPSEVDLDGYNFDYEIVAHSGEVPWVEQQAINLAEYLRSLKV
jgi:hypothetical protein